MKTKWFVRGTAFWAIFFLFCFCPILAQAAPKVTWNFHTVLGAGDPILEEGERWALNEIKKATNGDFEGVVYEKSTLGFAGPDIWEVVGKGVLPIAEMWGPHVQGKYPWITPFELPFIYDVTNMELTDYLVEKLWDFYAKPLAEDNLVLLGLTFHPKGRAFVVNKPLNQDPKAILKGMKIRVSGPMIAWVAETLGATPVMMDYAEVYEAGNRGIVNGTDPGVGKPFFAMKFHEIFKNVLLTDKKSLSQLQFGSVTWMIVANKDKFASLPAEWQKIIRDTFKKAGPRHIRIYYASEKEAIKEANEKYGMTYLMVPPETLPYVKSKAPEYWETWRKKAGPYGNKLLDDGLKLINSYKK